MSLQSVIDSATNAVKNFDWQSHVKTAKNLNDKIYASYNSKPEIRDMIKSLIKTIIITSSVTLFPEWKPLLVLVGVTCLVATHPKKEKSDAPIEPIENKTRELLFSPVALAVSRVAEWCWWPLGATQYVVTGFMGYRIGQITADFIDGLPVAKAPSPQPSPKQAPQEAKANTNGVHKSDVAAPAAAVAAAAAPANGAPRFVKQVSFLVQPR